MGTYVRVHGSRPILGDVTRTRRQLCARVSRPRAAQAPWTGRVARRGAGRAPGALCPQAAFCSWRGRRRGSRFSSGGGCCCLPRYLLSWGERCTRLGQGMAWRWPQLLGDRRWLVLSLHGATQPHLPSSPGGPGPSPCWVRGHSSFWGQTGVMGKGKSPKVLLELISRTAYGAHERARGLCCASRDSSRPGLTKERNQRFLQGIAEALRAAPCCISLCWWGLLRS